MIGLYENLKRDKPNSFLFRFLFYTALFAAQITATFGICVYDEYGKRRPKPDKTSYERYEYVPFSSPHTMMPAPGGSAGSEPPAATGIDSGGGPVSGGNTPSSSGAASQTSSLGKTAAQSAEARLRMIRIVAGTDFRQSPGPGKGPVPHHPAPSGSGAGGPPSAGAYYKLPPGSGPESTGALLSLLATIVALF